jgi:DNA-binding SARP family transcriptional activator
VIRIYTLGALGLRGPDGRPVRPVLQQPKRFALLTYLAVRARTGFIAREQLLALFWPELSQERARASLSQSIYFLRRSLGAETIVTAGNQTVGLGDERVWCDATAFEEALECGSLEEALRLYRGPFLDGFHIEGAREFREWLDLESGRLRSRAAATAWALSERAESAGSSSLLPVQWAKEALTHTPLQEAALRRLLALLDRLGEAPAALAEFERFAHRLRVELGVGPGRETVELYASLRARLVSDGRAPDY